MSTPPFSEFLKNLREEDPDAVKEFIEHYGEAIRRELRFCLFDQRLQSIVGRSDIFQSVVKDFFLGIRSEQIRIADPGELINLLRHMARISVAGKLRFWKARRRDLRRNVSMQQVLGSELPKAVSAPADHLTDNELQDRIRQRLTQQDQLVLAWREAGLSWEQIAERLNLPSADAARKQHSRSLEQLRKELRREDQ